MPLLGELSSPTELDSGRGGDGSPMFYSAPLPTHPSSTSLALSPSPRRASSSFLSGGLISVPSSGKLLTLPNHSLPNSVVVKSGEGSLNGGLEEATPPEQEVPATHAHAPQDWLTLLIEYAIRFSVHIFLLSVFESLFFWMFVSVSEDDALNKLVNGYVDGTLNSCPNWNQTEKFIVTAFVDLLVNRTQVNALGAQAAVERNAFNGILVRNSWLYVAGLCGLTLGLCAWALLRKRPVPWVHIGLENLALIVLLGLYEFVFFRSIVLVYRAVSGAELVSGINGYFVVPFRIIARPFPPPPFLLFFFSSQPLSPPPLFFSAQTGPTNSK